MEPHTARGTPVEGGAAEEHLQASGAPGGNSPVTEPLAGGPTQARNVLDREAVLAETARDPEFLLRLVKLYQQDSRKTLDTMRNGLATSDPQVVERAAHRIKGGLSFLRAHDAHSAALRLEDIGRQGNLDQAPEALSALERELVRLDQEIA
jgi:HPt (histidine-containing phosphotransfer) domain-containing protein